MATTNLVLEVSFVVDAAEAEVPTALGDITDDSVIAPRALRIGVVRVRLVVEGVWYVVRRLDHTRRQLWEIAMCVVHRLEGKNNVTLHCLHLLGGDGDQLQEIPRLIVIVLIKVPDGKD